MNRPLLARTIEIADAIRAGCAGAPEGAFGVAMELASSAIMRGDTDEADVVETSLIVLRDPERLAVLIGAREVREAERRVAVVRRAHTYTTKPIAAGYVRQGSPKAVHRSNSRGVDQRWDAEPDEE